MKLSQNSEILKIIIQNKVKKDSIKSIIINQNYENKVKFVTGHEYEIKVKSIR